MYHKPFIVNPEKNVKLSNYDPGFIGSFKEKEDALKKLQSDIGSISALQDTLNAQDQHALLVIFQAMDAAGKDGVIKHVMSGINPQGCQVFSFKAPSAEELDHDYLWRTSKSLPERGRIGIFNRSYYEEVLVVRVHQEFLEHEKLPAKLEGKKFWKQRYEEINNFEHYLSNNGIVVLKFFLNVSKEEQKKRFLERIDKPEKNWKFSIADANERKHWDEYMDAYQEMLQNTSTTWAPWYVIPADHKWFTRVAVSDVLLHTMKSLNLSYPKVSKERKAELKKIRSQLQKESVD
jgi:PPK2 family polyphosphate:nucleotide phosphotransferase